MWDKLDRNRTEQAALNRRISSADEREARCTHADDWGCSCSYQRRHSHWFTLLSDSVRAVHHWNSLPVLHVMALSHLICHFWRCLVTCSALPQSLDTHSQINLYTVSCRSEDHQYTFDPGFHLSLGQKTHFQDLKQISHVCVEVLAADFHQSWGCLEVIRMVLHTLTWDSSVCASHCFWQVAAPLFDVCLQRVIDRCRGLLSALSQSQMNKWIDHL